MRTEKNESKIRGAPKKDSCKIPLVCVDDDYEDEEDEEEEDELEETAETGDDDENDNVFKEKSSFLLQNIDSHYSPNHVDKQQQQQLQSPTSPNDTLEQIFSDRLFPRLLRGGESGSDADFTSVVMKRPSNHHRVDVNNIPNIRISAASSTHSVNSDKTPTTEQKDNYCVSMERATS